jgi:hypothetical protein
MKFFKNKKLFSSITTYSSSSINFQNLFGFNYLIEDQNSTTYYVMDPQGKTIVAFSEIWQYMFHKIGYESVNNMISVNKSLYTTTSKTNIFKSDKYLNISSNFNGMNGFYDFGGIYYNLTNNTFYVVSCSNQTIIMFSLDFIVLDSISTLPYNPFGIQVKNNQMFISTTDGMVLLIINKVIAQTFKGCINSISPIYSILLDEYNYLAISCSSDKALYLFNSNGTYTGMNMSTLANPHFLSFDSKGRFVVISSTEISVYI